MRTTPIDEAADVVVIVLEDVAETQDELQEVTVAADTKLLCLACSGTRLFSAYVDKYKEALRAVSIDWQLNRIDQGPEVLALLQREAPWAGRFVYTHHSLRRQEAFQRGADFFLEKNYVNRAEFLETLMKAARLGISRRIHYCLRNMEVA